MDSKAKLSAIKSWLCYFINLGKYTASYLWGQRINARKGPRTELDPAEASRQVITTAGSFKVTPIGLTGPHHLYLNAH